MTLQALPLLAEIRGGILLLPLFFLAFIPALNIRFGRRVVVRVHVDYWIPRLFNTRFGNLENRPGLL